MPLALDIGGLESLSKKLGKPAVRNALKKGVSVAIIIMQRGAIQNTSTGVTGILRNSFVYQIKSLVGTLYNTKEYGLYLHQGTKPHRVGVDKIEKRAELKGIDPYILQRHIATHGTKANPFMTKTYDENVEVAKKKAIDTVWKSLNF